MQSDEKIIRENWSLLTESQIKILKLLGFEEKNPGLKNPGQLKNTLN